MTKIEGKQIKYNMIKSVILKKVLFKRLIIIVENKNWTEDKRTLKQNIDRIILLNETGVVYKNSESNLFDRCGTKTINKKNKVETTLIPGVDQIKYIGFTLSKTIDNGIEKNK